MSTTVPAPLAGGLAWQAVIAIGVVHVAMGFTALIWPDATLTVLVIIVGIELIIAGVLRMLVAAADAALDARLLHGLLGLVSVVVGLLVMRQPLRSLGAVVALIGIFWVLWGLIELFLSLTPAAQGARLPLAIEGGLATLGGLLLLAWPELTVFGLTMLVGALLVAAGLVTIWSGLRRRKTERWAQEVIRLGEPAAGPQGRTSVPPST